MRFVENGPSIPDQLLRARDEGQVVFFCGAGVSRAKAHLHDFAGLANAVADSLGSARQSPARKLISAAATQQSIAGLGSLLPTDRVFSLLEREFEVDDVRNAVAAALRYEPNVDRSAHQVLLDLARGPDGSVRLVTTNFDHLFEEQEPSLDRHIPPLLPRPNRPQEWAGVVYLHGRLGDKFTAPPAKEEFVLSSTDFGRAYLSDGWATSFIRGLMEQFQLVFVGYAADDPPVQYLLEALNGSAEGRLYAFQSGASDVARSLWAPKGVEAISFSGDNDYQALWLTLEAWAERARNPEAWRRSLLGKARKGPRTMAPHERGQVRHVVSDSSGAAAFLESRQPAEWLCVFDPQIRYGSPEKAGEDADDDWDPFDAYALDDDPSPELIDPKSPRARRKIPGAPWSAFQPNEGDRASSSEHALMALSGPRSIGHPNMPPRLGHLATWVGTVSSDPITPWWAGRQGGLHPNLMDSVRRDLTGRASSEDVRRAWSVISTSLEHLRSDFDMRWFDFVEEVKASGWDEIKILRWAELLAPRVVVSGARSSRPPSALDDGERTHMNRLIEADVKYPKEHDRLIPDDAVLPRAAELVRHALVDAQVLEVHASQYLFLHMPPVRRDPDLRGDTYGRDFGISRLFFRYVKLLQRLATIAPQSALKEAQAWPQDELFDRLRLWAPGEWEFWPAEDFVRNLLDMDAAAFWDSYGQRDLLLSLEARWKDFSDRGRKSIVARLLKGPATYEAETHAEYRRRRAYRSLERLEWLQRQGFDLGDAYTKQRPQLLKAIGDWKLDGGNDAAKSIESSVGSVSSDEDPGALNGVPIKRLLETAAELGQRDWSTRFEEKRPYRGVIAKQPVRAFAALMAIVGEDRFSWAWTDFFYAEGRKTDGLRFRKLIAARLSVLPAPVLRSHIRSISHWVEIVAEGVRPGAGSWFSSLWTAVLAAMAEDPSCSLSGISSSDRIDWVTLALNSAAGDLAQGMMSMEDKQDDAGFDLVWLSQVEALLAVGGEVRRYASVLLLRHLAWFNYWAPEWTADHLLAMRNGDEEDRDAFWDGVLSASSAPPADLFDLLKDGMLTLAATAEEHDRTERLSAFILMGWGSKRRRGGGRFISSEEMRNLLIEAGDSFRSQIIWHLKRWSGEDPKWKQLMYEFLSTVWPRQRVAKSTIMSSRLFNLAIESERSFVRMVDLVEPLMTTIDADATFLFRPKDKRSLIVKHPEALLKLLFKALPRDAGHWPWGAEQAVNELAQQPAVAVDSRMADLRRRLAAR
ncbi:SIR2 family protein [Brevundimonas naejangsanensis]|uniref:SIR2 family protein n=1 Tax=Brevundimonas naejangsanensis TaxID=588932 RepID=UPI0032084579